MFKWFWTIFSLGALNHDWMESQRRCLVGFTGTSKAAKERNVLRGEGRATDTGENNHFATKRCRDVVVYKTDTRWGGIRGDRCMGARGERESRVQENARLLATRPISNWLQSWCWQYTVQACERCGSLPLCFQSLIMWSRQGNMALFPRQIRLF